jgi:Uma2 family endonuclease
MSFDPVESPRQTLAVPNAVDMFVHYYDLHPAGEDLMGSSTIHQLLIQYLWEVLAWRYRSQGWFITSELNIYGERKRYAVPVIPDLALFLGVVATEQLQHARSWKLYRPNSPPPTVTFEISSETTWETDLFTKPAIYAHLKVAEYYAYDPHIPPLWSGTPLRLRGWHRQDDAMIELQADERGWLWSAALQLWLAPDGAMLRMYEPDGHRCLTEAESERRAKEAEQRAKEQAIAATARALAEKEWAMAIKESERAAKESERAAKESERAAKETAWAKLRELGIDPEQL